MSLMSLMSPFATSGAGAWFDTVGAKAVRFRLGCPRGSSSVVNVKGIAIFYPAGLNIKPSVFSTWNTKLNSHLNGVAASWAQLKLLK